MTGDNLTRSSAHRQALTLLRRPLRKTAEERALAAVAAIRFLPTIFCGSVLFCRDDRGDDWLVNSLGPAPGFQEEHQDSLEGALVVVLRKRSDFLQEMIDDPEDDGYGRVSFKAQIRVARALADRLEALLPKADRARLHERQAPRPSLVGEAPR